MKKIYLLLLTAFVFCNLLHAQPGAVGTNNLNGAPFTCTALTSPSGAFKQARILATQSSAAVTWEFPASCGYPGDVWRPYAAGTGAVAFNTTIAPVGGTGSALYNGGNGGASGNLSSTTNGNYYTFNIENVASGVNAYMAALETNYNPVSITAVSNTTPANTNNAVLVTCTTSGAPASGEYVYVRYSTDITFVASSSITQFTFNGTTGQALIPCQVAGPVYYYVFSSNRTAAQIATDFGINGRIVYDMLALNLNNNGGANYTYTQGAGTNFGGIYSVPSTCYATVSNFVTALNGGTVTAPVTCYAIGGSVTETATVGGIDITKTGTLANPIIFQKFGSGNYTIQASAALTVGALNDGIFKLTGADYITIDGFILQENGLNATTGGATPNNGVTGNNMTEWGVALLRSSTTDGAQNNTIQNNTITLNKTYTNTFGIYSNVRHSATAVTVSVDIANNTTAPNNSNKVYGNNISNVNMGITFIGSGISLNHDVSNDIGGSSLATGNTITNWGGAAATSGYVSNSGTSYCIFVNHQTSDNVSYNTMTSATVSGTPVTFRGINKDYTTSAPTGTSTSTISNNTITMLSAFTSGTFQCIASQGTGTVSTVTVNINNNSLINCVLSGVGTSTSFVGIIHSWACGTVNITNNVIRGTTSTAAGGGFTGIQNSGAVVNTINITNNQVGNSIGNAITFSAVTLIAVTGISNTGAAATTTVNLNNNSVYGITALSTGQITGVSNSGGSAGTVVNMNSDTLRNTVITGVAAGSTLIGIANGALVTTLNMNNNVIYGNTLTSTTGFFQGLRNTAAVVSTINMNFNKLGIVGSGAVTFSAATLQNFNCIYNTNAAATATVNMNNNSIDGISVVTTGFFNTILNTAASAIAVNMNDNQLGTVTGTFITFTGPQSSLFAVLTNGGGSATATTSIQNNDVRGIVHSVAASCGEYYIYIAAANLSTTVAGNTFTNLSVNTTNSTLLIFDNATRASGQSVTYNNNRIITGFAKTGSGNNAYGFYSNGGSVNGTTNSITNNDFSNMTVTGATNIYGIAALDGASSSNGPTNIITGNTLSNLNSSGGCYGIYVDYAAAVTCSSNTISNLAGGSNITGIDFETNNGQGTFTTSSNIITSLVSTGTGGNVTGIYTNATSVPAFTVNGNTITGLSTTGASSWTMGLLLNFHTTINVYDNIINTLSGSGTTAPTANGIYVSAGTTLNVYRNKINSIQETGAISTVSPAVNGIHILNGTNVNVYNNFVADLKATNASMTDAIRGISFPSASATGTYNVYYNSVYINAGSAGTNFGTSGIYHTTDPTATTAALNMIDNIIVNTSSANGTGVIAAYRRSDATLTNYASTSDYNLFYAGTPSVSRLIYYDGTNSDQTLAAYKTRVSTRDANSISALPSFTSATDLHLTSSNCQLDGRGTPVGTITDDIDMGLRNVTAPDIGADEFTASVGTTLAGVAGSAICENRTVSVTGTTYTANACDLIAYIIPSGGSAVSGNINTCVTLDATQQFFNAEPYVQRHFDIEPLTANNTTTSATITLYFTDAEFSTFNTNNPAWPKLPTVAGGGSADPNRANLKVTQYHGTPTTTPSTPGNYTYNSGKGVYIDPADANIVWNGSYWAVTFNVTGFSGFYVHTNPRYALPITFNYLNGIKQGGKHLLNWKVTCTNTPRATLTLERSGDARSFSSIYTITADALRCQQPFDYTDVQPLAGMNYYRLKMMDADGKISYSNIIALLNAAKGFDIVSIAPNPVVSESFKLNIASAQATKMTVVISDLAGRIVGTQSVTLVSGYNSIDVIAGNLPAGTYNISGITANDKTRVLRFVKK